MRLAIAIIGLVLLASFLFQGVFENAVTSGDASTWRGGASTVFIAIPWLFAAMYVYWLPRLAAVLFIAAGIIAWVAAATTSQTDLWAWGAVAFILAAGAYRTAQQLRSKDAQKRDPGETMPATAVVQTTASAAPIAPISIAEPPSVAPVTLTYPCPVCGTAMDTEQRFCQECGTPAPALADSRPAVPA
jgi:hypothetical protein